MDFEQRRKWLWLLGVAGFLAIVGVASWKYGLPAYRHHKELRSLSQGRGFLQKGDYRSAVLALRQALAINSRNLEALRLMAELATATQSPAALETWRRVVEIDPSPAHKLRYAAVALRLERRPFPIASKVIQELEETSATNTAFHLVAAQLEMEMGRLSAAESHFQAAAQLDPTNRLFQLNLATIRLKSRDPATAEAARREIASLAVDTNLAPVALRSLSAEALQREALTEAESFSRQLLALPQANFQDRLQHLTVLKQAKSPELPATLELAKQSAVTNLPRVVQLLTWLNANDQAPEALVWIESLSPELRAMNPVLLLEAQSYLALKDWEKLESRLTDEHWESEEFLRLALLARAFREQGRREIAEATWRRALGAANPRAGMLVTLLELANSWNWNEEKVEILWAIVKRAPREDWAWQSLLQTYNAAGDTEAVLRVYSALLENNPNSHELRNNVASLMLLLNRDLEKAAELARQAYEADGTNAVVASTHAFALFRQGKATEGMRVMDTVPEASLRRPEIALYYAVLLNASGQREKAASFIALAEKARLLPEERQLLAAARGN